MLLPFDAGKVVGHTDSLVVITPQLIQEWRRKREFAPWASHIHLSRRPDIFDHFGHGADRKTLAIWRRNMPADVTEFVSAALDGMGRGAAQALSHLIGGSGKQSLCGGELDSDGFRLNATMIADAYARHGIDPKACKAFAEFFLTSVKNVLQHLPKGTCVSNQTRDSNYSYLPVDVVCHGTHADGRTGLVFNLSDPGTPYPLVKGQAHYYRTASGDITMHGPDVEHGFATAKPDKNGVARPRFFINLQVHFPRNLRV